MTQLAEPETRTSLAGRYEALIRVSQAIGAHREMKELFRAMSTELQRVVAFDGMVVVHTTGGSDELKWNFVILLEGADSLDPPPTPDPSVAEWVIERQQPMVIPGLEQETRFPRMTAAMVSHGLRSLCMLPLTTVHRRIGCLGFASRRPDAFDAEDLRFLSLVADQTAVAIDDALNFEDLMGTQALLREKSDRLQLLLRLNNAVVSNLELKDLFGAVSSSLRQAMRCDAVGWLLPDTETGELRGYAIDFPGRGGSFKEDKRMPPEMLDVFRTGKPLLLLANSDHPLDPALEAEGLRSICDYPIIGREGILGVLCLGRKTEVPFTDKDLQLLGQIAAQVAIAIENALSYRKIAELKEQLTQQNVYLEGEIRTELNFEEIVGKSETLGRVLKQVETVAPTDSTVLIYGDTGTGKELIARALHNLSSRSQKAFVKLNCAAIPTGLLESELFGHERGAFTGAVTQRIGRFELANQGTVFLDEIGEIPLELQPKLLRVLQEREFERLGSSHTLKSEARLIAATNRDLGSMVAEQKFRADLYYRLSVFPLYVPSLRERKEDIPLLVRHFVQHFARRMNRTIDTIPSEAMNVLVSYHWPGNIRELQNLIERAVILSAGPTLRVPLQELRGPSVPSSKNGFDQNGTDRNGGDKIETLEESERKHILRALGACEWVIAGPKGAAALLGLKRSTLQARMEKLGIRRARTAE